MRIAGIRKTSLVDGYGVNYTIFTQGCHHECEECHNPSTHDPNGGYDITIDELKVDISSLKIIQGVTFSGGEPLEQIEEVYELAKWCKQQNLQTTLYTGYKMINKCIWIQDSDDGVACLTSIDLQYFDHIIDGSFEVDKKTVDLPFRGSSNQRMLKKGVDY